MTQFLHSSDQHDFDNNYCFRKIIEEFKFLALSGSDVTINGVEKKIYFVVAAFLGDNLGINTMFGFNESFTSNYFCRFCRASKLETASLCIEWDYGIPRSTLQYKRKVAEKSGVDAALESKSGK